MLGVRTLGARIARLAMIVAVVLGLGACVAEIVDIPPGTYVSSDGQERIIVDPSRKIRFQVRVNDKEPDRLTDREFQDYQVQGKSGKLQPFPMRSGEIAQGIGKYTWIWKDGRIAKTTRKTGQLIAWFERQDG